MSDRPHPDYVAWVRSVHRPVEEQCNCTWPRIKCVVCGDTFPCPVERDLRHRGEPPVGIASYTT